MPKKSRVICVDDKIFKLLKNNGQVIAEGNKLSDSLQKVKTKADNMAAFKKAKKELNTALSKHGRIMKSWGKAYTYNVITALLAGINKTSITKLKCFAKEE